MKLAFTEHAVDQFVKRHAPSFILLSEARRVLEEDGEAAAPMKERTCLGQEQFRCLVRASMSAMPEMVEVIFVIKRDRNTAVCVTVLPAPEPTNADKFYEEATEAVVTARESRPHRRRHAGVK